MRYRVAVACLLAVGCGCGSGAGGAGGDGGTEPDPCQATDRPGVCPPRGLYDDPVTVSMSAVAGDDTIHYTVDGSTPTAASPTYDAPVVIAPDRGLIVLRAISIAGDGSASAVSTHSYLFPAAAIEQGGSPAGHPSEWGAGETTPADYELDARVLTGADRDDAIASFRDIATVSLVVEHDDVWGSGGIYMNPEAEGLEVPTSIELLEPNGGGFAVRGGVRVQGGSSTLNWKSLKLSLRLAFRAEYGAGKLDYPLFDGSPVDRFDTVVLDAHLNHTFNHPDHGQRIRSQYARDRFTSELVLAAGGLAPRSRYVHLYLNGLYWGLYDLHERPDDSFMSEHVGGARTEWDVLRHNRDTLMSGDAVAWDAMHALASGGISSAADYDALAAYLDIDAFIVYMLVNFYAGNTDWDHHNWYAARRRADGEGFVFLSWDAEHVLKDVNEDVTQVNNAGAATALWNALIAYPPFVSQVDAAAQSMYAAGAVLSPTASAALYGSLLDSIDRAVVMESARWGDARRPDEPYTRADVRAERDALLQGYFPMRSDVARAKLPTP